MGFLNFLTSNRSRFWKKRKIDWEKDYLSTWTHPHRQLIVWALSGFPWASLWEVGCGPGANLVRIVKELKDRQVGGSDINADAIEVAKKTFVGGKFRVGPAWDILLSNSSTDVVLSDAALIYLDPWTIKKALKEMARVARNYVVLCEFHGTNWLDRWILRLKTGYNAYDYEKLLNEVGCYDVRIIKIPPAYWDGFPWQPWGHIIIARVAKI